MGINMKTTIKDLARESGFSVATVSLALSDKPSRVNTETIQKIRKLAKKMNYTPNRLAVGLATQKSKMIGFVTDDFSNTYISANFMAIDMELQKKGYLLMASSAVSDMEYAEFAIKNLVSCGVEGIIYNKSAHTQMSELDKRIGDYLEQSGLPVVSCDNPLYEKYGVGVKFDYCKGGYLATKHLIENGHKKIGCLAGDINLQVTADRFEGYRSALKEAGIAFDPDLVYYGNYSIGSGGEALPYLLGQGVTAIFAFNDQMAFGIYKEAQKYHVSIPGDLSVIGFDNTQFCDVLDAPLTSVGSFSSNAMGVVVAKKMVELIEQKDKADRERIVFEPSLFLRGSTAELK